MAINREDWVRSVVPSGTVIAFAGVTPPTGWLLCNGSTISRAAYPALFTALSSGTLHGTGDGSTTFHLPDYSGRFLRGVANGSANDPDRAARTHPVTSAVVGDVVGSVQIDAFQGHAHGSAESAHLSASSVASPKSVMLWTANTYSNTTLLTNAEKDDLQSSGFGTPSQSSESRPKNANVNYIIKA